MQKPDLKLATHLPHITILMATYNGVGFIREQLDSIRDQSHQDWSLWIADDGSTDDTVETINTFRAANPDKDIRLLNGPKYGAAANFLTLLANPELPSGPVAFCDQDDIWMPDKLQRALTALSSEGDPAAYSCTDIPIGRENQQVGPSKHRNFTSFRNALVQNVMRGNSIVLNAKGADLIRSTIDAALTGQGVKFHDWWVYLVMTGAGGRVILDPKPGLYYRQHTGNVLGANVSISDKLGRAKLIWSGQFSQWVTGNLVALAAITPILTSRARNDLEELHSLRKIRGLKAAHQFWRSGLRHQKPAGTFFFAILAFFGKL